MSILRRDQGKPTVRADQHIVVNQPRVFMNENKHINVLVNHSELTFAAANLSMDICQNNGVVIISGRNLKVRIQSNSGEIINTGIKNEVHIQVETHKGSHSNQDHGSYILVGKKEREPQLPELGNNNPPNRPFWEPNSNARSQELPQKEPPLFDSLNSDSSVVVNRGVPKSSSQPDSLTQQNQSFPEQKSFPSFGSYPPNPNSSRIEDFFPPAGRNPYLDTPAQNLPDGRSTGSEGGDGDSSTRQKQSDVSSGNNNFLRNYTPIGGVIEEVEGEQNTNSSSGHNHSDKDQFSGFSSIEPLLTQSTEQYRKTWKKGYEGRDERMHADINYRNDTAPRHKPSDSPSMKKKNQPTNIDMNGGNNKREGKTGVLKVCTNIGRVLILGIKRKGPEIDKDRDNLEDDGDYRGLCRNCRAERVDTTKFSRQNSGRVTIKMKSNLVPVVPINQIEDSRNQAKPQNDPKRKTFYNLKESRTKDRENSVKKNSIHLQTRSVSRRRSTISPKPDRNTPSRESRRPSATLKQRQIEPLKPTKDVIKASQGKVPPQGLKTLNAANVQSSPNVKITQSLNEPVKQMTIS